MPKTLNITPDHGNLNCRRCGKYNVPACTRCAHCTSCCQCRMCTQCGLRHPRSACPTCSNCKRSGLCLCRGKAGAINPEQHLPEKMNSPRSRTQHPLQRLTLEPIRGVGIELELSSYSRERAENLEFQWTRARRTSDGSIRGENPMEFILGPIPGPAFPGAMDELARWLPAVRAQVNESCGLHVHVSAQDFGALELRRLIEIYRVLEPTFYSLVAPERAEIRYSQRYTHDQWVELLKCRGAGKRGGEIREAILRAVYGPFGQYSTLLPVQRRTELSEAHRRARQKYDNSRYVGMNLHSWFHRGTVEFRHCEGSVDAQRISLWTQWCKWCVEFASVLTDREVTQIHSPEDFLLGVWKRPGQLLTLPKEVVEFVQRGRGAVVVPPLNARGIATPAERIAVQPLPTPERADSRLTFRPSRDYYIHTEPPLSSALVNAAQGLGGAASTATAASELLQNIHSAENGMRSSRNSAQTSRPSFVVPDEDF